MTASGGRRQRDRHGPMDKHTTQPTDPSHPVQPTGRPRPYSLISSKGSIPPPCASDSWISRARSTGPGGREQRDGEAYGQHKTDTHHHTHFTLHSPKRELVRRSLGARPGDSARFILSRKLDSPLLLLVLSRVATCVMAAPSCNVGASMDMAGGCGVCGGGWMVVLSVPFALSVAVHRCAAWLQLPGWPLTVGALGVFCAGSGRGSRPPLPPAAASAQTPPAPPPTRSTRSHYPSGTENLAWHPHCGTLAPGSVHLLVGPGYNNPRYCMLQVLAIGYGCGRSSAYAQSGDSCQGPWPEAGASEETKFSTVPQQLWHRVHDRKGSSWSPPSSHCLEHKKTQAAHVHL